MSPRRKSGLSPEDLQALKHLPAVLTALEHLQEQHAKVRALMGDGQKPATFRPVPGESLLEMVERQGRALNALPDLNAMGAAERLETVNQWLAEGRISKIVARRLLDVDPEAPPPGPRNPTLDTPERREYEEAKRAGRKVPVADPFANASPAQRERMAEQRAIVDAERAARGMPTRRVGPDFHAAPDPTPPDLISDGDPETGLAVRTETLDTVSDGTTPLASDADDDPEVH